MRFCCHTQNRMFLTIIGFDVIKKAVIMFAEILVFRSQRGGEIVSAQIYDGHCRMEIRLSCIPTCVLCRIHIKSLQITIRHPPTFELGVVVASNTHTRVCYSHIVRTKIARNNRSVRTRSVLCFRREALFARRSIYTITTGITIADKLQLTLFERSSWIKLSIR